ncbi:N-acetylmuramoyl-L-alanine amidase [Nocardia sp. NPDC127579]|uniref:N-acetylmuramoyl-L-alanine amidase n=1 Tax=Nocardia sp. NPDC127579 TaxID=3345402 RepID=UPI003626D880
MLVPYRRPKRSYVLPVVTTLAVSAPLLPLTLADDTAYRTANDSEFAAVPTQLAEVVLSSIPDITLPLRELTGLELPDLHLSDLRRLPLPASIPVPEGLPLPDGVELPRQIPLPRFGADPGKYSIPATPGPTPAPNSGPTPGPAAVAPGQLPPASGQTPATAPTPNAAPNAAPQPGTARPVGPEPQAAPAPAAPGFIADPLRIETSPSATDFTSPVDSVPQQIGDPIEAIPAPLAPEPTAAQEIPGPGPLASDATEPTAAAAIPSPGPLTDDSAESTAAAAIPGPGPLTDDSTEPPAAEAIPNPGPLTGDASESAAAEAIPGFGPGTNHLVADPAAPEQAQISPDTPALAPGAIPEDVLEQVGAQVKELSRDTPFSMVALTAKDLAGTKAMVRAKQPDGSWGPWFETEPVDTYRNDRGAPSRTRGTEPIYVGSTNAVQILVTRKDAPTPTPEVAAPTTPGPDGSLRFPTSEEVFGADVLSELTAVLIDPGQGAADGTLTDIAAALPGGGPTVISRAGWGADESIRCEDPTYDDFLGGVTVHHTAGRNDYDKSESAGIVRSIYAYHAKTLGWCDIGYNALVDKYGQIFEGRAGGLDQPVQGAHAGGFNENTSGVALMGNHVSEPPTEAAIDAVGRFVGWRAKIAGLNPKGSTVMESEGTEFTPIPQGETIDLPIVFAHRDVGNTTCPGDAAYELMDRIREIAADAPGPAPRTQQQRQRKASTGPNTMPAPPVEPETDEDVEKLAALTDQLLDLLGHNVIAEYWAAKGGAQGPLGAPRTEPLPAAGGGQYVKFVNGYVYGTPNGQVFEVAGSILNRFLELGGDSGMLGLPVSNVYPVLNGLRSDFQNGSLIVDEVTGIVTTAWQEIHADPRQEPQPVDVAAPPAPGPAAVAAPEPPAPAEVAAPEAPREWAEPEFATAPQSSGDGA